MWFVTAWLKWMVTIAGRGEAGDRREPLPARSGRHRDLLSTARSIPTAQLRACAEPGRPPRPAARAQHEHPAPAASSSLILRLARPGVPTLPATPGRGRTP